MRFRSSAAEGWTSLADYVGRMKPEQEAIYVLAGDDADALAKSPQLEGFRARGVEVLLLTDPVDAFWPDRLRRVGRQADPQRDAGRRRPVQAGAGRRAGGRGGGRRQADRRR